MIIEYDIKSLEEHFRRLEQNRQAKRGIVVREATNEEIIKMLHENSFKVRLWGVWENIEDSFLRKLIKWRIDGLTINDPYIVEKLLN